MGLETVSPFSAYHATQSDFSNFDPDKSGGMIHVGTATQATMRGNKASILLKVSVYATALIRMHDKGVWKKPTASQREIADGIIYLNRFEGVMPDDLSENFQASDRRLKSTVSALQDSYGIYDPCNLRIVERIAWNSERHRQILAYEARYNEGCMQTPEALPLVPSIEAIEEAQAFCLMKMREQGKADLSGSSPVTSAFAQRLFGGRIEGNDLHQFLRLTDGDICDLNCEARDVVSQSAAYDARPDYRSLPVDSGQISRWISEFVRDSKVSREAKRSLGSGKGKVSVSPSP